MSEIVDREVRAVAKAPAIHTKNSHASPTPIVRHGVVFVHFGALGMARLSAVDGAVQWLNTELDYPPLHGSGGSLVLHDGELVVMCDGSKNPFVAAVDAQTGPKFAVLGKNEVPGRTFATLAFSGGAMYLRTDEHLYKFSE